MTERDLIKKFSLSNIETTEDGGFCAREARFIKADRETVQFYKTLSRLKRMPPILAESKKEAYVLFARPKKITPVAFGKETDGALLADFIKWYAPLAPRQLAVTGGLSDFARDETGRLLNMGPIKSAASPARALAGILTAFLTAAPLTEIRFSQAADFLRSLAGIGINKGEVLFHMRDAFAQLPQTTPPDFVALSKLAQEKPFSQNTKKARTAKALLSTLMVAWLFLMFGGISAASGPLTVISLALMFVTAVAFIAIVPGYGSE